MLVDLNVQNIKFAQFCREINVHTDLPERKTDFFLEMGTHLIEVVGV